MQLTAIQSSSWSPRLVRDLCLGAERARFPELDFAHRTTEPVRSFALEVGQQRSGARRTFLRLALDVREKVRVHRRPRGSSSRVRARFAFTFARYARRSSSRVPAIAFSASACSRS